MSITSEQLFTDDEQKLLNLDQMSQQQKQILVDLALRMISAGETTDGTISQIKYDGHLVVLDDGSRWEVDEVDSFTSGMWMDGDQVVVVNGEMFNLSDSEGVSVDRE